MSPQLRRRYERLEARTGMSLEAQESDRREILAMARATKLDEDRALLERLIDKNARQGEYAVFDADNTIWRYDLESAGSGWTQVTLTYDWSAVPPQTRDIEFPPFESHHLDNSLKNLAGLAERRIVS